jgi:hypothetical protein
MSELARTVTKREQADQGSLTLAPIWSNRSSPALRFLLGKSFIASLVEPDRPQVLIDVMAGAHLPAFDIAAIRHNAVAP